MILTSKTGTAVALAWIATLAGAYLLGGKVVTRSHDGAQGSAAHRSASGGGVLSAMGSDRENGSMGGTSPRGSSGLGKTADRILRLLNGATGGDLKRSEFDDLCENLSLDEVRGLISEIAAMDPSPAQRDAYQEVLARWAELDPTAALEHVAGIESPKFQRDATMNVLRHWAAVNPAAALAFAEGDDGKDLPAGALSYIFRGIGNSADTGAALAFLATLDGSGHEKNAFSAVSELFERNDTEVIKWAASLPEGDLRNRSIQALVSQWARYDPAAAKAWLDENTDDSNRAGAIAALGESWARNDPESAATWASQLAEGDANGGGKVLENVVRRWMEYDLASAAEYLVGQEPSPALDGALERYIQRIRNVDADASLAWAESISDPERRTNAIRQVAKTLRSQDPEAFVAYIQTSPEFSEAERAKLLGLDKPKDKDRAKRERKRAAADT
jgi:hypothetical protein